MKMKYGINGLIPADLIPAIETISEGDLVEAITVDIDIDKRKIDLRFSRKLTSTEAPNKTSGVNMKKVSNLRGWLLKLIQIRNGRS